MGYECGLWAMGYGPMAYGYESMSLRVYELLHALGAHQKRNQESSGSSLGQDNDADDAVMLESECLALDVFRAALQVSFRSLGAVNPVFPPWEHLSMSIKLIFRPASKEPYKSTPRAAKARPNKDGPRMFILLGHCLGHRHWAKQTQPSWAPVQRS